jgi:hypothetical protein
MHRGYWQVGRRSRAQDDNKPAGPENLTTITACQRRAVNGELDEYTTPQDVWLVARYVRRSTFAVVERAGHSSTRKALLPERSPGLVRFRRRTSHLAEIVRSRANDCYVAGHR